MATRAVQQVFTVTAWDTSANAPKTGDSANIVLKWLKDGTNATTTNACAEVDSTNSPGLYKVTLTSTETDCLSGTISGKSSTANIVIIPTSVTFEQIPNAVPGAAGGLFIAGTNAATTVTTSFTTTFTGNLTGSVASVTGAVGSVTGAVGSVTGAVGSVTGNVGGNVTGSVGSVVGAVGSVTGNVGGNVTGSVGSVVGAVGSVTGAVGSVTGAVGSVTGMTASDVGAIKAKTDNLPAAPASTTNITGGTITTVTNLTNAPTAGDFTATMKTSITTAVPTANANADALLDRADAIETGWTLRKILRIISAAVCGKVSGAPTAPVFRDVTNTKDRITGVATSDGNRTTSTLDGT